MIRRTTVAGQFYPSKRAELVTQIEGFLEEEKEEKTENEEKRIFGAIVPHAGYTYSGQAAASVYSNIAGIDSDTIVILGPNHTGIGKNIALSLQHFDTPLGIVKTDTEFVNELISAGFEQDERAHEYEHSIEVQLPFLQHIFEKAKKPEKLRIVTAVLSCSFEECKKFAEAIANATAKLQKKIFILASSDFTHYGAAYGFTPFTSDVKKQLYALDKKAISYIEKMDSKKFFEASGKTTICGAVPISVAIESCKALGAKKGELLKYYTSGEITGDYNTAVGYAGIVFV